VYENQDPGIYFINHHHHHLETALSGQEFLEIGCGAIGEQFCFPTLRLSGKVILDQSIMLKINCWGP
jgi:hypothetical protein